LQTIGEKIRELRIARGITQKELTAKTTLSASYLANLENNEIRQPGPEKLRAIARVLGTEWEEIVKGTDVEQQLVDRDKRDARLWCSWYKCPAADLDYYRIGDDPAVGTVYVHEYFDSDNGVNVGVKSYASYPAYTADGEPNRYCPACGHKLISECRSCGRSIIGTHRFCAGCGVFLWPLQLTPIEEQLGVGPLDDDDVPF
jgi:transcriptional regulator with XRE-family HTH domain